MHISLSCRVTEGGRPELVEAGSYGDSAVAPVLTLSAALSERDSRERKRRATAALQDQPDPDQLLLSQIESYRQRTGKPLGLV